MPEEKLSYFVGLDIGTTAVRCVVGELSGDSNLPTIIAFAQAPNSGLRKGNVAHVDEVSQAVVAAISEAERVSGHQIKSATVNVNGAHVESIPSRGVIAISSPDREITDDDRGRVEEAATIVQLPANKNIIQVFAKNYRLDGQENIKNPVGMRGVRLEVDTQIVMASAPALRALDQALESAELLPAHHTVTSLAAAEAVLSRKQKESGVAVLDIGAATTNLVVIEDGEVEHVAVVPMGGNHITNDLAIGLKTDLDLADMVKVKYASLNDKSASAQVVVIKDGERHTFDRDLMKEVVEARVEELLEEVDKELKKIHRSRKLPGGIVLVGGTAKLPGLVEAVKETLQLPARLGEWPQIKKVVDGLDQQEFAPAVGLMLLDMYLGPGNQPTMAAAGQGISQMVTEPLSGFLKQFRKRN